MCEFRQAKKVGVSVKVSSGLDFFVRPPKNRDSCQDKTTSCTN